MIEQKQKDDLKNQLLDMTELSKNLQEPVSEEEQKSLDDIMNQIQEARDFLDECIKNNKKEK